MLFNSFDFGVFLIAVYLAYWLIGSTNRIYQNVLLLASSYFFYGFWDWRFLCLLLASSLLDFYAGIKIEQATSARKKRLFLYFSIFWNLGIFFLFKYFDFFIDNFYSVFNISANHNEGYLWNLIIPVGLSFYTFQTLSYSMDVYKGKIKASNNIIAFLCFVSFFPQLVAGPIERANALLVQFKKNRKFDVENAKNGLRQIAWGLFKKMVVADNVAIAVNTIYDTPADQGSISLIYASALFFFQIYCDFSGYSDIAIGTAKLFGFNLSKNFNIPYLSKSVTEFWQRWHITLTRWFTDYVYSPIIKKNKRNYFFKTLAVFITMTLIGLWHGANWTFIAFGLLQAFIISVERIPFTIQGKRHSLIKYLTQMPLLFTVSYIFVLMMFSCIFFRSPDIETAYLIIKRIVSFTASPNFSFIIGLKILVVPALIFIEIITHKKPFPIINLQRSINKPLRWAVYYILIFLIIRYAGPKEQFIYFQF